MFRQFYERSVGLAREYGNFDINTGLGNYNFLITSFF